VKTFTPDDVIELTAAVMKAVRAEVDLDPEQLDACVDIVSMTIIKTLLASNCSLPWFKERSN
jgi:hypothetical protein